MDTRLSIAAAAVVAGAFILGTSPAAQSFNIPPGARAEPPDPNVPLYFEVASVRPNKDGNPGMGINRAPGGNFRSGRGPHGADGRMVVRAEVLAAAAPGADPAPPDPNAPDLFTAVREQLGLRFEATKGPVEVWVVDSIERPVSD